MPIVSVVITTHNPGAYLREALASVRQQHVQDLEVIVVDDASARDVSAEVAATLPDARLIRLPRNGGASVARNVGFLEARGRYIAVLDQDDVWLPDKLARQLAVMEGDPGIGLCHTAIEVIDEGFGIRRPKQGTRTSGDTTAVLIDAPSPVRPTRTALERWLGRGICASSVMFRRDLLGVAGLHDPIVAFCEDWDLWVRMIRCARVAWIPSPLVQYRRHDSNLSFNYRASLRQNRQVVDRFVEWARQREDDDLRDVAVRVMAAARHYHASWMALAARRAMRDGRWLRAAGRMVEAGWLARPGMRWAPHASIAPFRTAGSGSTSSSSSGRSASPR